MLAKKGAEDWTREYSFETLKNDGDLQTMKRLIELKNIFGKQLPKMPKEYIIRLMFDKKHESIALVNKDNKAIGGICYCVFQNIRITEIVFLAVSSDQQIKGFGSKIMDYFKQQMQTRRILSLMTCADNLAIGYFQKQGFHREIVMPKLLYTGYLKDYEGSTLMECLLDSNFIKQQKCQLIEKIKKEITNGILYKGIKATGKHKELKIEEVQGLVDISFDEEKLEQIQGIEAENNFNESCMGIINQLLAHSASGPFREAVKIEEVPDYFTIIKNPMDLGTMTAKAKDHKYKTKEEFVNDLQLIFCNARQYNMEDTIYYKYANELENYSKLILHKLKDVKC